MSLGSGSWGSCGLGRFGDSPRGSGFGILSKELKRVVDDAEVGKSTSADLVPWSHVGKYKRWRRSSHSNQDGMIRHYLALAVSQSSIQSHFKTQ